jgi:ABC-type sugar transport system permease subunit
VHIDVRRLGVFVKKVLSTLLTVIIAVGVSGSLWIGANLVFNQVRGNWRRFTAIAFGAIGFLVGVVVHGNRVTVGSEGGFAQWVWLPLLLGIGFAAIGIALDLATEPRRRQIIGIVAGAVVGIALGLLVRDMYRPELSIGALILWTVGGAVVIAGLNALRQKNIVTGALVGAAIGALIGGWGEATIGDGSVVEAIIAMGLPAVAIGARMGFTKAPDYQARTRIDTRSRAVIFLSPALLFILVALVIPAIRTIYLSLLDARSDKFVELSNYVDTFQEKASWDATNWTNMFTSRMFYVGIVLLALALLVGIVAKQRTGRAVEIGNPTVAPLLAGSLLVAFAALTSFRGTIVNNLWWVVTVVFFSTALGLAVAVLADGAKNEKFAKSLIFMPLAISLVGASVIWRFMYTPRDNTIEQTGLLNALWVGLGRLSTGSGIPTILFGVLVGALLLGLLYLAVRAAMKGQWGRAATPIVGALLVGWFFIRYTAIIGDGVGGFTITSDGRTVPNAIGFIQEPPFNNFWLMVILIWIQTGFAMVILSAAIKAVPDEILEAARVDGGTRSQIFWRVTLPQIATTIGVVVTTLIVLVMKVFDIVKVVTNGNFGTQVLANDMFFQAFSAGNTGRGAALAVILFVSVLPVMVYNIRRMQKEN